MLLIDYNFFVQHENGSSYSQRDTVKRESLDLWRHKKKTCHLSMLGKSFEIMVTCPVGNTDMTKGCTSGKTMLLYILVFSSLNSTVRFEKKKNRKCFWLHSYLQINKLVCDSRRTCKSFRIGCEVHATCNVEFGRDHHHSRVTVDLYIILSSHVRNLISWSLNAGMNLI